MHKILANMPLEAPPTDPNGGGDHVTDLNSGTNQNQSGCSC